MTYTDPHLLFRGMGHSKKGFLRGYLAGNGVCVAGVYVESRSPSADNQPCCRRSRHLCSIRDDRGRSGTVTADRPRIG